MADDAASGHAVSAKSDDHKTLNLKVPGSIPERLTTFSKQERVLSNRHRSRPAPTGLIDTVGWARFAYICEEMAEPGNLRSLTLWDAVDTIPDFPFTRVAFCQILRH